MSRLVQNVVFEVESTIGKEVTDLVSQMERVAPRKSGTLAESIHWEWQAASGGGGARAGSTPRIAIVRAGGTEGTAREQSRGRTARGQLRSGTFLSDVARYQEFGTSKMPANPFFWPIYRANRSRIRGALTRAVTRAAKRS